MGAIKNDWTCVRPSILNQGAGGLGTKTTPDSRPMGDVTPMALAPRYGGRTAPLTGEIGTGRFLPCFDLPAGAWGCLCVAAHFIGMRNGNAPPGMSLS